MSETHPNPNVPNATATAEAARMTGHLVQIILRRLVKSRQASEALAQVRDNAEVVAGILHASPQWRGRAASKQQVAGGLKVGGSLLYWAGWIALPLWIPALGAAVGTLGAVGVVAGFKWWQDAHLNWEFLKTFYSFLQMMEMADGVVTAEERQYLNDFLLSLPLSARQRQELQAMPVNDIAKVEIPAWYEPAHRESIAAGCWSLAYCDGVAPTEEVLFARMAEKLRLTPETVRRIQEEVARLLDETEEILVHIGAETARLAAGLPVPARQFIIERLGPVNARSHSEERLRQRISFDAPPPLPASIQESPALLDTVLAGAWLVASTLPEVPADDLQTWHKAFLARAASLGRGPEASRLADLVGQTVATVRQAAEF